jgi:hypothetical protein
VIDRSIGMIRRAIERMLPWYDRADRDRRARRTEQLHQRAIAARIRWEHDLDSYRRVRISK